jgi:hypothetical protein
MVGHRSPAPSPPWAGRDGKGRSGQQGWRRASEGDNGCPPANGSRFSPGHPRLGCCNDFKDASKAAAPPRLTALVSSFRTTKMLTEYDAVALELVREHRGSLKPGRVSDLASPLSAAHTYEVALAAPMAASSRARAPAVSRIVARRVARCTRCLTCSCRVVGSSVDRHTG